MKTNLIVVFYFGEKRRKPFIEQVDPLICLKTQVKYLLKYKHNLNQITFVINGSIPKDYDDIVKPLKEAFNVVTLKRENIGISYGGFAEAATKYLNDFDFFIFLEDDWFFCYDYFDEYLINKFQSDPKISMVCAVSSDAIKHNPYGPHAAVSIYCSSQDKIKELIKQHGEFPYAKNGYGAGQVRQTSLFFDIGKVIDVTDDFFVRFLDQRGNQSWGDSTGHELALQLDFIENFD